MADIFTVAKRSQVMAAVHSRGNRSTELRFSKLLRELKVKGWRRGHPILGRPDFVFPKLRLAVFIDGCFWHGCPRHGNRPTSNQIFWNAKIERNISRDRFVSRQLRSKGWRVMRIWEHELRPKAIKQLGRRVLRLEGLSGLLGKAGTLIALVIHPIPF